MPLSEHEQRLLDEIEQALYAEDPKFAASVRSARSRSRTRRSILVAVFGVLAGLALVLVGLVFQIIALSVVGFVLVVGACTWVATVVRGRDATPDTPEAASRAPKQTGGGLRNRMEDRLKRRFDEN
ncbi:MAG: DUF3040 domain-containing protein [Jatrophihabitans sp.]